MTETESHPPAWWETLTFTHGPETEWFAHSVFREACRAGKTIYWRCNPTHRSVDDCDQLLVTDDFRLVLEHLDAPRTRRGKATLHRVYVRWDGIVLVNREGSAQVTLSLATSDHELADRLAEPAPAAAPSGSKTRTRDRRRRPRQ